MKPRPSGQLQNDSFDAVETSKTQGPAEETMTLIQVRHSPSKKLYVMDQVHTGVRRSPRIESEPWKHRHTLLGIEPAANIRSQILKFLIEYRRHVV